MKIDENLHISIEFENSEGNKASLFINHLDKRRFDAASSVLGEVYRIIQEGKIHPDVFVIDWPVILKDYNKIIDAFIEALFMSSEIISNNLLVNMAQSPKKLKEQLIKAKVDEDTLNSLKGLILFISALLRYTTASSLKTVKGLFTTYKDAQEWRSLHTYSIEQVEEKDTKSTLEEI